MISMSFGFPSRDLDGYDELERAIEQAYSRHVLLFAAASNSGGQLGRAYPARDIHVGNVHSTDTHGNCLRFSPTAAPEEANAATVGETVESSWPAHLCHGEEEENYCTTKSGQMDSSSFDKFLSR